MSENENKVVEGNAETSGEQRIVGVEAPKDAKTDRGNSQRGDRRGGQNRRGDRNNKNPREEKKYFEELLSLDRVTRVTTGGRQLRFRAVIVIGDKNGKVAVGTGKSWEVVDSIAKAVADAKKRLVNVQIIDGSLPYDLTVKYKSAKVFFHPATKGTGVIAGGAVRKVLSVAGYTDVIAKRYGSNNKINNARATIKALTSFKKI